MNDSTLEQQMARAADRLEQHAFTTIDGQVAFTLAIALGHATQCEVFRQKYGTYMQERVQQLLKELQ